MNVKKEKHLDLELLIFFLFVAITSFFFYIFRHPVFLSFMGKASINYEIFSAYFFDLIVFLIILLPYIIVIAAMIYCKITKKIKKISDNIMIVLFFPLLSFFTKGMSLLHVYIDYNVIEIFYENFAFFSFLFVGPAIIFTHKVIVFIRKKRKLKKERI